MIPRRTITFYPGMWRDIAHFMFGHESENPVPRFEKEFASYVGVKHAVSTCSGTDAMILVLDGLNLQPGDHLLSTAYTIRPLMGVFKSKGYDLELVDISTEDFNLDVEDLKSKLRPDTKAVIVTHMFGTPARMDEIRAALKGHSCFLIEDAAHAHGATYKRQRCGSFGYAAFFSFDQIKPLSTFGGGMAVTNDENLAAAMRQALESDPPVRHRVSNALMGYLEHALVNSPLLWLISWLTGHDRLRETIGVLYRKLDRRSPKRNRRLSAMQAYLGLKQLEHLEARISTRQKNAAELSARFRGLVAQKVPEGATSTYYKFTALAPSDSALIKKQLFRLGIDIGIKDDINYPCYLDLSRTADEFPGTSHVYERLLDLPGYETLSPRKLQKIGDSLSEIE